MTIATKRERLWAWMPEPRNAAESLAAVGHGGALPGSTTWPTGLGPRRRVLAPPAVARWGARARDGLGWARQALWPVIASGLAVTAIVAAFALANWLPQPPQPYGYYRSDSPLQLSGVGSGQTEAFPLEGGDVQVSWYASTEWGCRLGLELVPQGGGAPMALADTPVAATAGGVRNLRNVTPGEYMLRADSACLWTVRFGPAGYAAAG